MDPVDYILKANEAIMAAQDKALDDSLQAGLHPTPINAMSEHYEELRIAFTDVLSLHSESATLVDALTVTGVRMFNKWLEEE